MATNPRPDTGGGDNLLGTCGDDLITTAENARFDNVLCSVGDDILTVSLNAEAVRLIGDNNTRVGGLGFGRTRYDSFPITSVDIDANASPAQREERHDGDEHVPPTVFAHLGRPFRSPRTAIKPCSMFSGHV
ncbi:hypothetical protein ABIE58_003804 [Roseovarius sp. MBR-78]|uniref:hypothetical protein n=1 Tax=Roseovarius sp. MBR-78 TaxID=3156460 RepID=UPI0033966D11